MAETATPAAVTAVRFWSLGEATRIAIEITGEFEYETDRLRNPDRVYYDILGARNRVSRRRYHTVPVGDSILRQIRVATTQHDTRIVFDLKVPADVVASQLTNPSRLIVELRRSGDAPSLPQFPQLTSAPKPVPALDSPPPLSAGKGVRETPAPVIPASVTQQTAPPKRTLPVSATEVAKLERLPRTIQSMPPTSPVQARRNKGGSTSMVRALGLKIGRVILDPGHGGYDYGTIGPGGLSEKELVLDVAKRLGALIEERMGSEVIYTRTDDRFIPLEERTALANAKKVDLFLSIHANSSQAPSATGVETYYLNLTSNRAELEVAARENASAQKGVHELRDLLQQIALTDKIDESREFAAAVQATLHPASLKVNSRSRNRGVKKAPFVVLIGASMPSVLTEIGFLSNPNDEKALSRPQQRQRIAEALFKGLSRYAATLSHFDVAQAVR